MKYLFKKIPLNARSIANRRKVFGVGVNDADYKVTSDVNGKQQICPCYQRWKGMIERCYSLKFQDNNPTYIGCSVCSEWLIFSRFKFWVGKQNWEGLELDKDIISPGNKIYSPDTCCFVSQSLNLLLNDHKRGDWHQGVGLCKRDRKFRARVKINGKTKYLGYYSTHEDASNAYIKAKVEIILDTAATQSDERIANGLRAHAKLLSIKLVGVDHEHST